MDDLIDWQLWKKHSGHIREVLMAELVKQVGRDRADKIVKAARHEISEHEAVMASIRDCKTIYASKEGAIRR